jgi:ABC-type transporter Mla maintaining outer membrane lipid asymmetry ATPase subunit MlaF
MQTADCPARQMDITRCTKAELKKIHRSIGVAFQSAVLFNSLTVEDNIALPLRDVSAVVSEMNRTMGRAIEKPLSPMPADVGTGTTVAERN